MAVGQPGRRREALLIARARTTRHTQSAGRQEVSSLEGDATERALIASRCKGEEIA
jgi:hypothetical protein